MSRLTELTQFSGTIADDDNLYMVDVSDTTDNAAGSSFKVRADTFRQYFSGNNVVSVNSKSDFPAPSGGVITLADNTTYVIHGVIDIGSDRIVVGSGTAIQGVNRFTDFLSYSGTGVMLTATANHTITECGLICPNGQVLSLVGSGSETAVYTNSYILSCNIVGSVAGWRTLSLRSFSVVAVADTGASGLLFAGACSSFQMSNSLWQGVAGLVCIDLFSATFDRIQITGGNRFVTGATTNAIGGLPNSGNLNAGGVGLITGNLFDADGSVLSPDITQDDLQWQLEGNAGLQNSYFYGCLTKDATSTTAITQNVYTPVTGTTTDCRGGVGRWQQSADNMLQDLSVTPQLTKLEAIVQGAKATGSGSDTYAMKIYRDQGTGTWTAIDESINTAEISTTGGGMVSSAIVVPVVNEKFAVYITNTTSGVDFDVSSMKLEAFKVS